MNRFLRAALVFFFLAAIVAVVAAVGCGERSRTRGDGVPFAPFNATTPAGVPVTFPTWVPPDLAAEALLEIDAAGLPPGWSVIVRLPVFETPSSPTGIARGLTDYERQIIEVGWRFSACEDRPLLPALGHETSHVYGGPLAGH